MSAGRHVTKSLYASPAIPKETARLSGPHGKNAAFGHSRRPRSACCGSRRGRHSEDCPQRLGESRCGAFCSCAVRDHAAASARAACKGFAAISDGLCRRRSRQASERPFLYALPPVSAVRFADARRRSKQLPIPKTPRQHAPVRA